MEQFVYSDRIKAMDKIQSDLKFPDLGEDVEIKFDYSLQFHKQYRHISPKGDDKVNMQTSKVILYADVGTFYRGRLPRRSITLAKYSSQAFQKKLDEISEIMQERIRLRDEKRSKMEEMKLRIKELLESKEIFPQFIIYNPSTHKCVFKTSSAQFTCRVIVGDIIDLTIKEIRILQGVNFTKLQKEYPDLFV